MDITEMPGAVFENQRLVSVSCPCPGVEPMALFAYGLGQERFYWADCQTGFTYVGLGLAADLQAWGAERFRSIANQVTALFDGAHLASGEALALPPFAEPRLFGGFAFSNDFTPDNTWSIYHPAQFILPHYQLAVANTQLGGTIDGDTIDGTGGSIDAQETWLTLNTLVDADEDAAAIVEQLQEALAARVIELQELLVGNNSTMPAVDRTQSPLSHKYPMSYERWSQMLGDALIEFESGRLQKVVLSRVSEVRFADTVDVDSALAFLNYRYPDCTRFVFEPRAYHAFFGASPEILVHMEGRDVTTMGLAGSAPRGGSPEEDARLGQGLQDSRKDQYEHGLVVDAIRHRLEPLCPELIIADSPELLKLSNIQHLFTPIQGQLVPSQPVAKTIFDLVEVLHPTPALGGAPRADALPFIDHKEPVPRGWYAAPVGIVDRHLTGTFNVAIRSAVTEYERVWLHAGAGIVAGSDPQMEWDETALKFRPILGALGMAG